MTTCEETHGCCFFFFFFDAHVTMTVEFQEPDQKAAAHHSPGIQGLAELSLLAIKLGSHFPAFWGHNSFNKWVDINWQQSPSSSPKRQQAFLFAYHPGEQVKSYILGFVLGTWHNYLMVNKANLGYSLGAQPSHDSSRREVEIVNIFIAHEKPQSLCKLGSFRSLK